MKITPRALAGLTEINAYNRQAINGSYSYFFNRLKLRASTYPRSLSKVAAEGGF